MHELRTRPPGAGKALPFVLLLLVAGATGLILSWLLLSPSQESTTNQAITLKQATLLPELRGLPPFSLTDQAGMPFDNQRLLGEWTLLAFGYTYCPDVCPTNLAMLAEVDFRLRHARINEPYQIGFVSVDPERDTPQRLANYVSYFDPAFLGITGSKTALQALTQPLGILYRKVETKQSAMDYVMDHSANLVLLDPQGRYYALFSPPYDADKVTDDLLTIMNHGPAQ
jgi:protein SCO1